MQGFIYKEKMMKLYDENGWVNIKGIIDLGLPFNFCVGGRGTGKTYTSLKTIVEEEIPFMFMRRTQAQADIVNKPEFSPFKPINIDLGKNIISKQITKYNAGFYDGNNEGGLPIGYSCALSTVSNIRGFSAEDVDLLIYDEFIPEAHERPIKNEGAAFLNAYETINRNRELKGKKPLQVLCLANSNIISNPIFIELGFVKKVHTMFKKGQEISIDRNKGVGIFLLGESPISKAKKSTVLYNLTSGSDFERMSLENSFNDIDTSKVARRPLIEYKPIVAVGELCIYLHKSNGKLYCSTHLSGTPPVYTSGSADLLRFWRAYNWVWFEYLSGNLEFEEILCEILLTKYRK